MSNYFTSGIDAVVVDLGRQIDIIRKDDSLRASPRNGEVYGPVLSAA